MLDNLIRGLYHRGRRDWRQWRRGIPPGSPVPRDLYTKGFAVVPDFWTAEQCAAAREAVDQIITDYSDTIWRDPVNSDTRIFHAEAVSPVIARFAEDPKLLAMGRSYVGDDLSVMFTLANRVVPQPGGLGSGQGWHRDNNFERQYKAILYLSDVGPENGPFTYLPGSHRFAFYVREVLRGRVWNDTRWTDEQVAALGSAPVEVTGKAGTLILTNTLGIHRGKPIEQGIRYALTNYCFTAGQQAELIARGKFIDSYVDRPRQPAGNSSP